MIFVDDAQVRSTINVLSKESKANNVNVVLLHSDLGVLGVARAKRDQPFEYVYPMFHETVENIEYYKSKGELSIMSQEEFAWYYTPTRRCNWINR